MKRIAKVTLIVVLLGVIGVFTLWLGSRESAVPGVRVYQLLRVGAEPADTGNDPFDGPFDSFDWSFPDSRGPEPEAWNAKFQIRVPEENGLWLTRDEIAVELLGPEGSWTKADVPPTHRIPDWVKSVLAVRMRKVHVSIPQGTRACRFTLKYRVPTIRERGMNLLDKLGFERRFPKVAAWVGKRLPDKEQWLEVKREVQLPAFVSRTNDTMTAR